jgi:hypothetical protein
MIIRQVFPLTLFLVIMLFILSLSVTSVGDVEQVVLNYGTLDSTDALLLSTLPSSKDHYIISVPQPLLEEDYLALVSHVTLEGFIPPSQYIIEASKEDLQQLHRLSLINHVWAYPSSLIFDPFLLEKQHLSVTVVLFDSTDINSVIREVQSFGSLVYKEDFYFVFETDGKFIPKIAALGGVMYIEEFFYPVPLNDAAVTITGVTDVRQNYGLYGEGQIVAMLDTGLDSGVLDSSMHDDFQGRIISLVDVSGGQGTGTLDDNGHGTHMAGTILGDGTLSPSPSNYAGVAPQAQLYFQAAGDETGQLWIPGLYTDVFLTAFDDNARVHSDSWGVSAASQTGAYSFNAQQIDKFIWDHKDMNIIFGAGNNGFLGINSVSPEASSKNALAVGASENYKPSIAEPSQLADNIDDIWVGSSLGPTDDGRVKPDVVTPATEVFSTQSRYAPTWPSGACTKNKSMSGSYNLGPDYGSCGGTSSAAAHAAGLVTLVREYWIKERNHNNPSAALIKATVINSAVDMGFGVPSNESGWGRVNLTKVLHDDRALYFIDDKQGLKAGKKSVCQIGNVDGGEPLKVTLVWSDKDAAVLAPTTLVNDLHLEVQGPGMNTYYGNDFSAPFDDTRDLTNNVENVIIDDPTPGSYTLTVKVGNIMTQQQPLAFVVSYKEQPYLQGPFQPYPFICLFPH